MADVRTFGDLMQHRPWTFHKFSYPHGLSHHVCKQCRRGLTEGLRGLWGYSTRAHLCEECIQKRKDEVLPAIVKQEKFAARTATLSSQARTAAALRR